MAEIFKPIKQSRISEEVTSQIKDTIIRGKFKQGDKLPSERELAEQFNVSRAVIREALWTLVKSGFIVIRPGATGGAYVSDMSFRNLISVYVDLFLLEKITLHELTEARLLIEPEMARLAAKNITPEYEARLKEAIAIEKIPSTSIEEDVERKQQVHLIIAEMSGNRCFEGFALASMAAIRSIIEFLQLDYLHPEGAHQTIVDAIISGNSEAAAQAMIEHAHLLDEILKKVEIDFRSLRNQADTKVEEK